MKNNKYGVSLMVLILTVIIMTILAGTVIISLNNAGIIERSQGAVNDHNLKQVDELANLGWGEAYLAGKRTKSELKTYVMEYLEKNGVKVENYDITVTTKGVEVATSKYMPNDWEWAKGWNGKTWTTYNPGEEPQGTIIAKAYLADTIVDVDDMEGGSGDKYTNYFYDLIVEGAGSFNLSEFATMNFDYGEEIVDGVRNDWVKAIDHIIIKEGITEVTGGIIEYHGTISIPNTVTNITTGMGGASGGDCSFILEEDNPYFKLVDGCVLSKDGKVLEAIYEHTYNVPTGVEIIEADYGETWADVAIIPKGVKRIQGQTTYYSWMVPKIKILSTDLEYIYEGAFDCLEMSFMDIYVLDEATKELVTNAIAGTNYTITVVTEEEMATK